MSKTNRIFVIAYIVLVGLPILGLVGVLKKGRSLTAPISVDGTWTLKADAAALAALPCAKALAGTQDATMSISQSGGNFTLNLNNGPKAAASGTLDGTTFKASVPPAAWPGESGCASGQDFSIVAKVDPKANPRSLTGTLSLNGCASCAPVEFQAVRQTPAKKGAH